MKQKNVLFLSVTKYNLERDAHLEKKFGELSKGIRPCLVGKGRLSHKMIWGTDFYLLPPLFFFWPLALVLAFYICVAKRIDLVIAQSPLVEGLVGTILKKLLRKELIIEIHGDWQGRSFSFLANFTLKRADKIRAVAQYLIDKAKKIAPQKPYFIFPTFTDLDKFLGEKDIRFEEFVLFVGRSHKVKGIEYLIEAFSKIKKDFPNFKLVLVGEGLSEGKLSLKEVKNKMKNCYCLVIPSLSEGLPRVLLEAQALAKPVIASRVGGIPEIVKDGQNGFLVEPANSDDLAEKIKLLLANKDLAVQMGRRGRELIQDKFSNEKYIKNYLRMIHDKI